MESSSDLRVDVTKNINNEQTKITKKQIDEAYDALARQLVEQFIFIKQAEDDSTGSC